MPTVMIAIVLNSLVVELRNAGYKLETDFVEEPKRVYHQGLKINNE